MENTNMDKKCEDCAGGVCHGGMCGCGSCCGTGMGHGCHGGKHHLVKMILKIFIVILIFWCGFRLGQMVGFIKAQTGYGYGAEKGGWGMMRGWDYNNYLPNTNNTVVPPAPTKQ